MACERNHIKVIRLRNVSKSYQNTPVLEQINGHLAHGEFAFLHGRSGSGKSTLLKLLYRDIEADHGTIEIEGQNILHIPKHLLRRKIGVIFQSFELLEKKTVFENVALAGQILGRHRTEIAHEAQRLLERVGLANKKDAYPNELSGGQQQRVAVVRALLNKPKLILADEPTGNLDRETAFEVMELLYELHKEEKLAMLVVSHSTELMKAIQAKHFVMEAGKMRES
ncbi:MAG: cell division ATP-binding protein FtsE [Bacillus sp. (in: firmicutes)]